ncbi:unnamed protein product [Nezara viridula]|uniref:Uncharacterized protein n=1 Tax=Nezara viridula TaxID=85310 RepID=A0A9P0HB73_NEZVI|nr:unnamed protein product [Nezara viridula]
MVWMTCQTKRYHGTARSRQDPQSAEPRQSQGSLVLSSKIMSSFDTIDLPGALRTSTERRRGYAGMARLTELRSCAVWAAPLRPPHPLQG